jgi:two-component system response regulator HydG
MSKLYVLVVDDNRAAADALARLLGRSGHEVRTAYDGASAIDAIRNSPPDIVLTDLRMEPLDGMSVLYAAREMRPPVEVILMTAYSDVDVAVQAMRMGARDFLTKPVTVEQVLSRLDQLVSDRAPASETEPSASPDFVARSPAAAACLAALQRAAAAPSPVLIEGEVGSGRGHAALTLHRMSTPDQPFTVRDLGRDEQWPTSGTVLLPNVDDLPDDLQAQLVRALQRLPDGVRLISTAGPDSRRLVTEGRVRAPLYYKLAVVVIPVPPLRRRREDVRPLIQLHLDSLASRYGRPLPEIPEAELQRLERHQWPGNIRELFNVAERAVVMGSDDLQVEVAERAPEGLPKLEPGFNLSDHMDRYERRIIVEALRKSDGDRNRAGELLGVARNTLRYKLKKYELLDN